MLKFFLSTIFCWFCVLTVTSQVLVPENKRDNYNYTDEIPDYIFIDDDNIPLYNKEGEVEIFKDSRLDFLVEKYNESKTYVGYRVQIYSGKDRTDANKVREIFVESYPDVAAHLIYQQPNFKLRLGDFQNRLEALRFHDKIKLEFPSAFVIQDEISIGQ